MTGLTQRPPGKLEKYYSDYCGPGGGPQKLQPYPVFTLQLRFETPNTVIPS